jgi:hypothetical protein
MELVPEDKDQVRAEAQDADAAEVEARDVV